MHSAIVSTLSSLTAFDDIEAAHLAEILAWLQSTADIYRRAKPSTPDRHLAVYCVPVDINERKVFLGHHLGARRWLPPGGHVDTGEHPRNAAIRECGEELGVVPDLYRDSPILVSVETTLGADSHTDVTLWFAFDCSTTVPLSLTETEFNEQRWVLFDDVAGLDTNPNLNRFLAKLLSS
jgi:8-oxo-dGTP diphosphatase